MLTPACLHPLFEYGRACDKFLVGRSIYRHIEVITMKRLVLAVGYRGVDGLGGYVARFEMG